MEAARTNAEAPRIALIVPVGGPGVGFERCVSSLTRLAPPPDELVVVLDGEQAARAQRLQSALPSAVVLTLEPRRGPAAARNAGAAAVSRVIDVLFFVDADVELPRCTVDRVREFFIHQSEYAAVIGSYDDAPAHAAWVSRYRNLLHHWVHQQANEEASTFWGACGAIRKASFVEIEGFDERISEPSIEDIDLGHRLRRAGHRIALHKSLQVKHLKRWTVLDMLRTDLWRRAVPWTQLMLRDGELLDDLNVKTKERWSVMAAGLTVAGLALASFWPRALLLAAAAWLAVLLLHAGLYRFFARHGVAFALVAMFWHFVYLLVCGLGYSIGWLRHLSRARALGH